MGTIANQYSDILIATDDDPSSENRLEILQSLTSKITQSSFAQDKPLYIIPERTYAIQLATQLAQPGDIVVLAGKGHEKVQLTNFGKRPRNDKTTLLSLLK